MLSQVFSDDPIVQELVVAVKEKSKDKIQSLAKKYVEKLSVKDSKGLNAAMYVGTIGDKEACQLFIEFGAKSLDCAKGAAFGGHEELARELAGHNSDDYPALCVYAAWGGQKSTTAKLLNRTRTNKRIDSVRICKQIADAAKRGGHTELEKNYIKLAKVREAKKSVNDEESLSQSPGELEIVQPISNTGVPVVTATATKAAPTVKPVALTKPVQSAQSAPPRKSIQVTESIPTFAQKVVSGMTTPSILTTPQRGQNHREQPPLRQDAPRANQPVAPSMNTSQSLLAQQTPPPARFSAPALVQKAASAHLVPKQVSSETSKSLQQTTVKDKASSPLRSDEESRKSPITNLYQASVKSRSETSVNQSAKEDEVSIPSMSGPKTLSEALLEIQSLKAKVSMLEIALKNKQTEVTDLRQFITQPSQKPAAALK